MPEKPRVELSPTKDPVHNSLETYTIPVDAYESKEEIIVEQNKIAPGSLFAQTTGRDIFRNQQSRKKGDILRVMINIQSNATLNNAISTNSQDTQKIGAPTILGLENRIANAIPFAENVTPDNLIDLKKNRVDNASGDISRTETIKTEIAAMVTQILPNGNLVIFGQQEILISGEIIEFGVSGIVSPDDITSDNSVTWEKIAEARVSYGGKGSISDIHNKKYGDTIIDTLSPF